MLIFLFMNDAFALILAYIFGGTAVLPDLFFLTLQFFLEKANEAFFLFTRE